MKAVISSSFGHTEADSIAVCDRQQRNRILAVFAANIAIATVSVLMTPDTAAMLLKAAPILAGALLAPLLVRGAAQWIYYRAMEKDGDLVHLRDDKRPGAERIVDVAQEICRKSNMRLPDIYSIARASYSGQGFLTPTGEAFVIHSSYVSYPDDEAFHVAAHELGHIKNKDGFTLPLILGSALAVTHLLDQSGLGGSWNYAISNLYLATSLATMAVANRAAEYRANLFAALHRGVDSVTKIAKNRIVRDKGMPKQAFDYPIRIMGYPTSQQTMDYFSGIREKIDQRALTHAAPTIAGKSL